MIVYYGGLLLRLHALVNVKNWEAEKANGVESTSRWFETN